MAVANSGALQQENRGAGVTGFSHLLRVPVDGQVGKMLPQGKVVTESASFHLVIRRRQYLCMARIRVIGQDPCLRELVTHTREGEHFQRDIVALLLAVKRLLIEGQNQGLPGRVVEDERVPATNWCARSSLR